MTNPEQHEINLNHETGEELLSRISSAIGQKDINALRIAVDSLQNAVDEKMMCTPVPDAELEEFLKTGKVDIYVGTGSAGQRIYIEKNRIFMPVSEEDMERGYGKRCQDNFRRLFNIPEGQELSVLLNKTYEYE